MCGLELPLFRCVDDLIAGRIEPQQAMALLMGRGLRVAEKRRAPA